MNTHKLLFLSCFWIVTAPAMNRPSRVVAHKPEVRVTEIVSEYKNPVIIKLMNVIYDQRTESFQADSFGELKTVARVGKKETTFYNPSIPMVSEGDESRACLSIDDTVDGKNFIQVWLRKVYTADGGFFEFPDIVGAKEEFTFTKEQRIQTIITLKLCDKDRLGKRELTKNIPFVEATSQTIDCANK